jgi:predicted secreted hydrolase
MLMLVLSACGTSTAELGAAPTGASTPRPAAQFLTPRATPGPVDFPADDGPHQDLTEWWYYTGHLRTADGKQYGFEFVIFQGSRAGFPPIYASHFAITDVAGHTFHYDQRTQRGGQPQSSDLIDLHIADWSLTGDGDQDHIIASMPEYALDITVDSRKPPTLHDGDGYFEWAPATGSYYYSRTSMAASGTISINGQKQPVAGHAWMDHQWGNFLLVGGGGWDWFSIQLDSGEELMLWHSRDSKNDVTFGSGTFVEKSGATKQLGFKDFDIQSTAKWTSPRSGATYPSGWTITIPALNLHLTLEPVMNDQELDTRNSTGVIYWEGDVTVTGTENGAPVSGHSYVELTGYAGAQASP